LFKPIESNELVEMQRNRKNAEKNLDSGNATSFTRPYAIEDAPLQKAAEGDAAYGTPKTENKESKEQKKERLQKAMKKAAATFDFITAAQLRDELLALDKD